MPAWARYAGAIYFGLMMSGALAPPDWATASTPPPRVKPVGSGLAVPPTPPPPGEARSRIMGEPAIDASPARPKGDATESPGHRQRHTLPDGEDLLR